jgi:hypothetical protein
MSRGIETWGTGTKHRNQVSIAETFFVLRTLTVDVRESLKNSTH